MIPRAASVPCLTIVLLCLCAGSAWAKSSDRDQPTNIQAGSSDCFLSASGSCILTGNVVIQQGTLDIRAAKADLRRAGNGDIETIKLTGSPVKLKQQTDDGGWMNATSSQIDYDLSTDTVVFSGDAVIVQPGKGSISGERIVYNMATGQVRSGEAAGGGRVNMTFEPSNTPAEDAEESPPADEAPAQDEN